MNLQLEQKHEKLINLLERLDGAIVAYSGGIDSALLLKVAYEVLGRDVIGATADSPSLPRSELEEAKRIAGQIGVRHVIFNTKELESYDYLANPNNRCYYCKKELYTRLKELSNELGIKAILNGTNLDDLGDYRPGLRAAVEFGIMSPLKDAGFTKQDIRDLANRIGLEIWDKPSSPCLSSRVPYTSPITLKKLSMIEDAESCLKQLGIRELRVRHFGDTARIEVNEPGKKTVEDNFLLIKKRFSEIGFNNILVSNFKSGALNLKVLAN